MRFLKNENRIFDLKKTLDEIISEAVAGNYNYEDKFEELSKLKSRS